MEHLYLNFNKASVILRDHRRDITPPGMVEIVNAIPPRSDSAITIRPDFITSADDVYGFSSDITLQRRG